MPIISIIFTVFALIAFIWNMFGTLPGIVLLCMALTAKDSKKKKKYFKWSFICFGGIILLVSLAIFYSIFALAGAFLGFSLTPNTMFDELNNSRIK